MKRLLLVGLLFVLLSEELDDLEVVTVEEEVGLDVLRLMSDGDRNLVVSFLTLNLISM